jgi:endo-1,4-beta-xylanase
MNGISRRDVIAGVAAGGAALLGAGPAQASEALSTLAARAGLLFGGAIDNVARLDPGMTRLFAQQAGILVTENALKFDYLRPDAERFEFGGADAIAAFAKANGQQLRGHTLIWNDNAPDWLKRRPGREVERIFDAHIDRVVERYAGRLHSCDVVNEPFWPMHGRPGGYRDGPWLSAMGPSYIARAFRRVAAIDKTARLTLNEAFCETNHEWGQGIRPRLRDLVAKLQDDGAPLHAVGFQAHLLPHWPYDDSAFAAYAESFAARGLDIYITELDVNDEAYPANVAERDRLVAKRYGDFLRAVLAIAAVRIVMTWQLSDRASWLRDIYRRAGKPAEKLPRPLPFDDALKPKAAVEAIAAAFAARRVTP